MTASSTQAAPRSGNLQCRAWRGLVHLLEWLQSPALLATRLYVAYVFFASGVQSLRDWNATLWLYENEFRVALLPPHVAAVLGTAGEVLLPPLLALGLSGRFGALACSWSTPWRCCRIWTRCRPRPFCSMSSGAFCSRCWRCGARASGRQTPGGREGVARVCDWWPGRVAVAVFEAWNVQHANKGAACIDPDGFYLCAAGLSSFAATIPGSAHAMSAPTPGGRVVILLSSQ